MVTACTNGLNQRMARCWKSDGAHAERVFKVKRGRHRWFLNSKIRTAIQKKIVEEKERLRVPGKGLEPSKLVCSLKVVGQRQDGKIEVRVLNKNSIGVRVALLHKFKQQDPMKVVYPKISPKITNVKEEMQLVPSLGELKLTLPRKVAESGSFVLFVTSFSEASDILSTIQKRPTEIPKEESLYARLERIMVERAKKLAYQKQIALCPFHIPTTPSAATSTVQHAVVPAQ